MSKGIPAVVTLLVAGLAAFVQPQTLREAGLLAR